MKVIDEKIEVQTNGVQTSVAFGIKKSGLSHIFNVLRNQLYSDKIGAVIREYSANAVDANKEAGNGDIPIEVTLPTVIDPVFKVRDFGPSLNDEEIKDVYANYGESTKRNSNEQIGMLGLGSKSAFAYGDSFVINSYINGVKHVHTAFIDETKVGQISKLGASDTNERDGVEIVIGVDVDDCEEFSEKAIKLYKHFKVKPVIHGLSDHEIDEIKVDVLFEGDNWKYIKEASNYSDPTAVMGGIPYGFDPDELSLERNLKEIVNGHLIVECEIGELSITASREALEMTDRTKTNLVRKLKKVNAELQKKVEEKFGNCKTMWDAKRLMGEICDYGSALYQLADWAKENITFNGKQIKNSQYNFYNYDHVTVRSTKRTSGGNIRFKQGTTIEPREKIVVVKNDVGHVRGALGKITYLQQKEEGRKVYLINFSENTHRTSSEPKLKSEKEICKEMGFDAEMLSLKDLPKPPRNSTVSTQTRTVQKTFEYDTEAYRWSKWRDRWTATEIDVEEDEGVFVEISRYVVQRPESYYPYSEPHSFHNQIEEIKKLLGEDNMPEKIIGFTKVAAKKLKDNPNWVELHEWVADQVLDVAEEKDIATKASLINQVDGVERDWFLRENKLDIAEEILGEDHSYVKVQRDFHESSTDKAEVTKFENLARNWGFKLKKVKKEKNVELKDLAKQVEEDYPLVKHVTVDSYYDRENIALKALCNNMVQLDECN